MKTTVNVFDFCQSFKNMNRGEQFSHAALVSIFDYLTEIEESTGEDAREAVLSIVRDFLNEAGALVALTDNDTFVYRNL